MSKNYWQYDSHINYPEYGKYAPPQKYPEYPYAEEVMQLNHNNQVYETIRNIFIACKFDWEHVGQKEWNPLGMYVLPGDTVLLKPNLVRDINVQEENLQKGLDCMITHPSIVRVLFDYVYIALSGKGKIIIADAPVQGCDFKKLLENSGYGLLFKYFKEKETDNLKVDIADLRDTIIYWDNGRKRQKDNENRKYKGVVIDLGTESYFQTIESKKKLRVTDYAAEDTIAHHNNGKNEYCISSALLEADVVINIVKPKTHRIAGYTASLKNMVGICTRKEYLPHHRQGEKKKGGDEYGEGHLLWKYLNSKGNDVKNWALKRHYHFISDTANAFARKIGIALDHREVNRKKFGFWYGNDTIWRTILDVNRIVYYCNKDGVMQYDKQRTVLHFGDMIVCGEKEGPLHPSYKKVGGILFSDNPVAFDFCVTKLMGLDYQIFPTLINALNDRKLNTEAADEINLRSNRDEFSQRAIDITKNFGFELSSGWMKMSIK